MLEPFIIETNVDNDDIDDVEEERELECSTSQLVLPNLVSKAELEYVDL